MSQQIRISAKWHEQIDLDKLALALLDFIESMTDEETNSTQAMTE